MKIVVSGAHGLVGSALVPAMKVHGHLVQPLPRAVLGSNPSSAALEGAEAVVHLAGESIIGRWTESKKKAIHDSRVVGTQRLSEAIGKMSQPPKVFISASAIGYYGDRGDETLTEESASGKNFLSGVCRGWESA